MRLAHAVSAAGSRATLRHGRMLGASASLGIAALAARSSVAGCELGAADASAASQRRPSSGVLIRPTRSGNRPPASATASALVYARADKLFDQNGFDELTELLRKAVVSAPEDAQLLWRLARALRKLSDSRPKHERESLLREGLELAQQAIALQPDCGAAHKWAGVLLAGLGDFEGTTATIQKSFQVAEHFEKAVALSSEDATARHLLGKWCFEVAKLSWVEMKAASLLFATPPQATYEQAFEHFAAAEAMDPGFYPENQFMLAQVCAKLKRKEEAAEWRLKCLSAAARTPEDVRTQEQCRKFKL